MGFNFKVLAVAVLLIGVLLALVYVMFPRETGAVSVSVESSAWILTEKGYVFTATVKANRPTYILYVEAGGEMYRTVHSVDPPASIVRIPLPVHSPTSEVVLHFGTGQIVRARPASVSESTDVLLVPGASYIYLIGTLPQRTRFVFTRIATEYSAVVAVEMGRKIMTLDVLSREIPGLSLSVYEIGEKGFLEAINASNVVVFVEVFPDPELLSALIASRKTVVLHSGFEYPGSKRFRVVNNTPVVYSVEADRPEVDYFGIRCIVHRPGQVKLREEIRVYEDVLGRASGYYGVSYLARKSVMSEVYAESENGDVYLGKTAKGFYYSSISFKHLALLVASGFFLSVNPPLVRDVDPFAGVKLLDVPVARYQVLYVTAGGAARSAQLASPRVTVSGWDRFVARLPETARGSIAIYRVSVNGTVEEAVYESETAPSTVELDNRERSIYLVYLNSTPYVVIGDEMAVQSRSVVVEYSEICETYYVRVRAVDRNPSPLYVYLNGDFAAVLRAGEEYMDSTCRPYVHVEVRNAYGDVVYSRVMRISRFYEQPLFILAVLMALGLGSAFITITRQRAKKTITTVSLIVYRQPEISQREVDYKTVASIVEKIAALKGFALTQEVFEDLYKRSPRVETITDAFASMLESGKVKTASRYIPDLGDTVSVLAAAGDPVDHLYRAVLRKMGSRYGITEVSRDLYADYLDADAVLVAGNNYLIVTFAKPNAPDGIRSAVSRAFTSFLTSSNWRTPLRPIGFIVVTEPEAVGVVNKMIDSVLSNEQEAERILYSMSEYSKIRLKSPDYWLSTTIMTAVPVTNTSIALLLAKLVGRVKGAAGVCNKYYRFSRWV